MALLFAEVPIARTPREDGESEVQVCAVRVFNNQALLSVEPMGTSTACCRACRHLLISVDFKSKRFHEGLGASLL